VLLRACKPEMIRSKMDQSTGDPAAFYKRLGFEKLSGPPIGRKGNTELFVKGGDDMGGG